MVDVEVDVGLAQFGLLGRTDLDHMLFAEMVLEGQFVAEGEAAFAEKDRRRQDVGLAVGLLELEEIDRIVGMLEIEDQLLFGRLHPQFFGQNRPLPVEIDILDAGHPLLRLDDFFPIGPEGLLIDPVGRPVERKGAVLAEQEVLQVAGGVGVALPVEDIGHRRRPQDLRAGGDAPVVAEVLLHPRQFLVQDVGHPVEKAALVRLLEARSHRPAGQLVNLHGRLEALDLGLELGVVAPLVTDGVGGLDHRLLAHADGGIAIPLQGLDDGEHRRRTVEPGQGVVGGIDDPGAAQHRLDDPADLVAVGVVAVIVDHQVGVGLLQGIDQFADPLRRPQAAMVLDAEDDVGAGDGQDLADLADIVGVGVLGPGGEADAGFVDLAGQRHLFEYRLHVGDVVEEIEGPPDVDVFGEFPHGQADDVLRVRAVAEEIGAAAQGLEHRLRHRLAQQFELEKGVDLLAQHVDMDRGAAGDLEREIAGRLPSLGRHQVGVEQDAVLEVGLGEVTGRVGDIVAVGLAQGGDDGGSIGILNDSGHIGIRGMLCGKAMIQENRRLIWRNGSRPGNGSRRSAAPAC